MSDESALLAAIIAHPDEDTPRLAYADWLDEVGGESNTARAEYTRLSIELDRAEHGRTVPPEHKEKEKRSRALFWKHYREWFPELFGKKNFLRGARAGWYNMSRGFLYKLQCDAAVILRVGERLTQVAPVTEFQILNVTTEDLEQFVCAPWTRGVRKIGLSGGWGSIEPDWSALADAKHFTELRDLALSSGWLDAASARRITAKNLFPKLERFYFGLYSSDDAPAALFSGKAFTKLRALDLSGGGREISGKPMPGLKEICASRALKSLTSFNMGWRPTPGLTAMLTSATFWPKLEELDLLRNNLGNNDLAAILNTPSKLRTLELDDNKITAKGAKFLAEHPSLARITALELSRNRIGDTGFAALVKSPHARNLRKLEVSTCGIGLAGFTALAESPHVANLRELSIYSNDLDLKGARLLAESPNLTNLDFLSVSGLSAAGKKVLKARFGDRVSL